MDRQLVQMSLQLRQVNRSEPQISHVSADGPASGRRLSVSFRAGGWGSAGTPQHTVPGAYALGPTAA